MKVQGEFEQIELLDDPVFNQMTNLPLPLNMNVIVREKHFYCKGLLEIKIGFDLIK